MPKGPKGEKRPADVIGAAVMVAKIATGEIEDTPEDEGEDKAAQELGRKGGKARAEGMTPELRAEIARKAAVGSGVPRKAHSIGLRADIPSLGNH